jgi:D-amino peptidase
VDGVMFVGYHARAGTERAILDHTWSGKRVVNLRLNGDVVGETGLNAALCGHFEAPVVMVAGDRAVCEEARALLDGVETVEVKAATGRSSARCLAPEVAQKKVYEGARRAVAKLGAGEGPDPFRVAVPVTMTIEFPHSAMADAAALLPGIERDGRRLSYTAEDVVTAFKAMRSALALAA